VTSLIIFELLPLSTTDGWWKAHLFVNKILFWRLFSKYDVLVVLVQVPVHTSSYCWVTLLHEPGGSCFRQKHHFKMLDARPYQVFNSDNRGHYRQLSYSAILHLSLTVTSLVLFQGEHVFQPTDQSGVFRRCLSGKRWGAGSRFDWDIFWIGLRRFWREWRPHQATLPLSLGSRQEASA